MSRETPSQAPRQNGFTLLEVAMVLLIMGLLITITATTSTAFMNQKRRAETQEKLKALDTALTNFVIQNQRLPCPADGTMDSTNGTTYPNAGKEITTGAGVNTVCSPVSQANGVVPWKTLGLGLADGTDSWGNMFTYRVEPTAVTPAVSGIGPMNFTYCTGAGGLNTAYDAPNRNYCGPCTSGATLSGCYSPLAATAGRGLIVKDLAGNRLADPSANPSTGAAYVLISHGENLQGAYTPFGVLISTGSVAAGTEELNNYANAAYAYLVDDATNYNAGATHFDDFVSHPSLLTLSGKATLGPRAY